MIVTSALRRNFVRLISKAYGEGNNQGTRSSYITRPENVPGLSSAVIFSATEPVGPGVQPDKSGVYKTPEYFCYNRMSFYEAEVEIAKYRNPPPVVKSLED